MANFGPVKTWGNEVLTPADLNAEILNIINNVTDGGINADNIDETDAYTWSGATTFTGTVTTGVDDTGVDVKFFGATTGKSWLWDESADTEILTGNSTISGTLGVTGVLTATAQSVHTGGLVSGSNIVSDADSTDDLGTTSARWANLYVDSIGDTGQALAFTSGTNNTTMTAAILALTGAQTVSSTLGVTGLVTATAGISSGSNIVSDTDSTDDLGTTGVRWANLYVDAIVATDTIAATSYTGALLTAVTAVTQSSGNNSTKVATTAYADAAFSVGATHTWTADQTFNDSVKVTLGTGGDADLYYDGTNVVLLPRVVGTGNVGINTTTPLEMLDVTGTTSADQARIVINDTYNGSASEAGIDFYRTYDTGGANQLAGYIRHTRGGGDVNGGMVFGYGTRGSIADKMIINSSGNVGIGTASPNADLHVQVGSERGITPNAVAATLYIEDGGTDTGMTIGSGNTNNGYIIFADTDNNAVGQIRYDHSGDWMGLFTGGAERMRINSSGKVGIGNTSPSTYSNSSGTSVVIGTSVANDGLSIISTGNGRLAFGDGDGDPGEWQGIIQYAHASDAMTFATANTVRMTIASDGNVGIDATPAVTGRLIIGQDTGNTPALRLHLDAATTRGIYMLYTANTPDDNTQYFMRGDDQTAIRIYIYSDGDIANHDGTYGTISDVKFKQDITDARGYWDDFKALQYRKFRHKTDVEADPDAPYRLGLIAQEVETVFPALAPESPDADITETINVIETVLDDGGEPILDADGNETTRVVMIPVVDEEGEPILDADGNETLEAKTEEVTTPSGTTHKWVKSSIIEGPIMASVVQELMARVEALEAA